MCQQIQRMPEKIMASNGIELMNLEPMYYH